MNYLSLLTALLYALLLFATPRYNALHSNLDFLLKLGSLFSVDSLSDQAAAQRQYRHAPADARHWNSLFAGLNVQTTTRTQ